MLEIRVETVQVGVPVAIIAAQGDIDASNYQRLVNAAYEVYNKGVRNVLLDLTGTGFVSSSGLVALHSIALLMRGEKPLDPESGWDAVHAMDRELESGMQEHVKLLNPQTRVDRTLERTGLKDYFAVFTDRKSALESFSPKPSHTPAE